MEDGTTAQDATDTGPDPDSGTDDGGQDITTATPDELRRARSDAAKYRNQLRDVQKSLKELKDAKQADEDAKKSEMEKLMERTQSLETKVREGEGRVKTLSLETAVLKRANALGIVDPDAAWRLLDSDAVEYDDKGQPTNIEDLLKDLVEAKPYLKGGKAVGDPAAPKDDSSPTAPNGKKKAALTHADIEKMTDDEINARWDEVQKVLASAGR